MIVRALKINRVSLNACTLLDLLDEYVTEFPEHTVLAITSKIVSLCEGSAVPVDSIDREELIRREAASYVELPDSEYPITFTVMHSTLVPNAGVDESNADGAFVLWPHDPQATANMVRAYLCKRFTVREVGVVITDSTV